MAENPPDGFAAIKCQKWKDFTDFVSQHEGLKQWMYRGQVRDWPLCTSLERCLNNWHINLQHARAIERQLVRDFRRRYQGGHRGRVDADILYCLAMMQHHGAPTRLLDWTYSPFVAAKFAIEAGSAQGVIWCLNGQWVSQAVVDIVGEATIRGRDTDSSRNDTTFKEIYMEEGNKRTFVYTENPFHLNERLIIQQGVFACPGDIGLSFVDNLKAMAGWQSQMNVVKIIFQLDQDAIFDFSNNLTRMNVNSAALFPGLDGFARSLGERLPLLGYLARRRIGDPDHERS